MDVHTDHNNSRVQAAAPEHSTSLELLYREVVGYSPDFQCFSGLNWDLPAGSCSGADAPAWTLPEPSGPLIPPSLVLSSSEIHSVVSCTSEEAVDGEVMEGGEVLD